MNRPTCYLPKEFAVDHSTIECARCGVHLPLKRDLAADQTEWVCANCGWQMPGILDPAARETIADNVEPIIRPACTRVRRRERRSHSEPLLMKLVGRYFCFLSSSSGA